MAQLLSSIQLCGTSISSLEVADICQSLDEHGVKLLSLRESRLTNDDFGLLMGALGKCKSVLHLNLNLGVLDSRRKVEFLTSALLKNRSLTTLLLHGSSLDDAGFRLVGKALALHPNIVTLDIGDCSLGDRAMPYVTSLLPPHGAKPGLKDLTLSANPDVSRAAWTRLFIAMASSCTLQTLNLDYNHLGDHGCAGLAVAMAACQHLQKVDLEGTGLSEYGGQTILHLVRNYPVSLRQVILTENEISAATLLAISQCLDIAEQITAQTDETRTEQAPAGGSSKKSEDVTDSSESDEENEAGASSERQHRDFETEDSGSDFTEEISHVSVPVADKPSRASARTEGRHEGGTRTQVARHSSIKALGSAYQRALTINSNSD